MRPMPYRLPVHTWQLVVVGCLACMSLWASSALAQSHPTTTAHHSRIFSGVGVAGGPIKVKEKGETAAHDTPHPTGQWGFVAGYSQNLVAPWFSVVGLGRLGLGAYRTCDLSVGPELQLRLVKGSPSLGFYLSVPAGLTWTWMRSSEWLATVEHHSRGYGYNVGATVGITLDFGRHGLFLELGALRTTATIQARSELKADPTVSATQTQEWVSDRQIVSLGYLFRL